MDYKIFYLVAAELMLFTHLLFVLFVIVSLILIFLGKLRLWSWVKNPWFRTAHLFSIGVVVLQSWLGIICPLTKWEMALRVKAGSPAYEGSFVSHWLENILYYDLPEWFFIVCYTSFFLLVAGSWFWVPPRPFTKNASRDAS